MSLPSPKLQLYYNVLPAWNGTTLCALVIVIAMSIQWLLYTPLTTIIYKKNASVPLCMLYREKGLQDFSKFIKKNKKCVFPQYFMQISIQTQLFKPIILYPPPVLFKIYDTYHSRIEYRWNHHDSGIWNRSLDLHTFRARKGWIGIHQYLE